MRLSRRDQGAAPRRRPGFRASARNRHATEAAARAVAGSPGWGRSTCVKVIVPKRSSRVRQASSAAGTAAASIPRRGNAAGPIEMLERRQPRRSPLPRDHRDPLPLGIVNQDRHFAAETERARVGDAQRQDRGRGRIRGVTPLLQDLEPRGHGVAATRGNRPLVPSACQSVPGDGRRCHGLAGPVLSPKLDRSSLKPTVPRQDHHAADRHHRTSCQEKSEKRQTCGD